MSRYQQLKDVKGIRFHSIYSGTLKINNNVEMDQNRDSVNKKVDYRTTMDYFEEMIEDKNLKKENHIKTEDVTTIDPTTFVDFDLEMPLNVSNGFKIRESKYILNMPEGLTPGYSFRTDWHTSKIKYPSFENLQSCNSVLNIILSQATTPGLSASCLRLRDYIQSVISDYTLKINLKMKNQNINSFELKDEEFDHDINNNQSYNIHFDSDIIELPDYNGMTFDIDTLSRLNHQVFKNMLIEPLADIFRIWETHQTMEHLLTNKEPGPSSWSKLFTHSKENTIERQKVLRDMFFKSSASKDQKIVESIFKSFRYTNHFQYGLDFLKDIKDINNDSLLPGRKVIISPELQCNYALFLSSNGYYMEGIKLLVEEILNNVENSALLIKTSLNICRKGGLSPTIITNLLNPEQLNTPIIKILLLESRLADIDATSEEAKDMVQEILNLSKERIYLEQFDMLLYIFCERCYQDQIEWLISKRYEYGINELSPKCIGWIIKMYLKLDKIDKAEYYLNQINIHDPTILIGIITGYDLLNDDKKVIYYSILLLNNINNNKSVSDNLMENYTFAIWKLLKYNRKDIIIEFDKKLRYNKIIPTSSCIKPILLAYLISFDEFQARLKYAIRQGFKLDPEFIMIILRNLPLISDKKLPKSFIKELFSNINFPLNSESLKLYMEIYSNSNPLTYINLLNESNLTNLGISKIELKAIAKYQNTPPPPRTLRKPQLNDNTENNENVQQDYRTHNNKNGDLILQNIINSNLMTFYPKDDIMISLLALSKTFEDMKMIWNIHFSNKERKGIPKQTAFNVLTLTVGQFPTVESLNFLKTEIEKFNIKPSVYSTGIMLQKIAITRDSDIEIVQLVLNLIKDWNYLNEPFIQIKLINVFFKYGKYSHCFKQFVYFVDTLKDLISNKNSMKIPSTNFLIKDEFYDNVFKNHTDTNENIDNYNNKDIDLNLNDLDFIIPDGPNYYTEEEYKLKLENLLNNDNNKEREIIKNDKSKYYSQLNNLPKLPTNNRLNDVKNDIDKVIKTSEELIKLKKNLKYNNNDNNNSNIDNLTNEDYKLLNNINPKKEINKLFGMILDNDYNNKEDSDNNNSNNEGNLNKDSIINEFKDQYKEITIKNNETGKRLLNIEKLIQDDEFGVESILSWKDIDENYQNEEFKFNVEDTNNENESIEKMYPNEIPLTKKDEIKLIRKHLRPITIGVAIISLIRISNQLGYNHFGKGSNIDSYLLPILKYSKNMGIPLYKFVTIELKKYFPSYKYYLKDYKNGSSINNNINNKLNFATKIRVSERMHFLYFILTQGLDVMSQQTALALGVIDQDAFWRRLERETYLQKLNLSKDQAVAIFEEFINDDNNSQDQNIKNKIKNQNDNDNELIDMEYIMKLFKKSYDSRFEDKQGNFNMFGKTYNNKNFNHYYNNKNNLIKDTDNNNNSNELITSNKFNSIINDTNKLLREEKEIKLKYQNNNNNNVIDNDNNDNENNINNELIINNIPRRKVSALSRLTKIAKSAILQKKTPWDIMINPNINLNQNNHNHNHNHNKLSLIKSTSLEFKLNKYR